MHLTHAELDCIVVEPNSTTPLFGCMGWERMVMILLVLLIN